MAIRVWRLPDGQYLIEGPTEPFPLGVGGIRVPGGETIDATSRYYLVTAAGQVQRVYGPPRASSVEDTLYITDIHAIAGEGDDRRLIEFNWKDVFDHDRPEIFWPKIIFVGLTAVQRGELPFDPDAVVTGQVTS